MNSPAQHNFIFSDANASAIKGFQEAIISVSDFEGYLSFLTNYFGWEIIHQGTSDRCHSSRWELGSEVNTREALLRNPGTNRGYLRVLHFTEAKQRLIRSSASTWDTGGIFDLNIRVHDMGQQFPQFEKMGWNGYTLPHRYTFAEYDVSEVLMKGPDGIVFAAIQRFDPPLIGFTFEKVSRIFNSSLISSDLDESHDFYTNKLGFHTFFQTAGNARPNGPNVLGIPPDINGDITIPINIYKPDLSDTGSIELLQFMEISGVDHSQYACPPNLGILMLRFPIRDADTYLQQLEKNRVPIIATSSNSPLPPYGNTNIITIKTPEGAWFEFVELIN